MAAALTARDVILPRQLDRGLGGLRSAGDQVEPRVVHGNTLGQGRRELLDRLRRELGAVNVGELTRLVADRIGDLAHAVADPDDDGATRGVNESPPGFVPDERALTADRARKRPAGALAIEDPRHGRDFNAPADRLAFLREKGGRPV